MSLITQIHFDPVGQSGPSVSLINSGLMGQQGAAGLTAYQVAVANGFVGDETAWLASLQGSVASFIYTQSSPAAVWTVPHNLNKRPSVTTVDHLGAQIFGDLVYVDDNIVQIIHGSSITGAVYCN